jgi:AraC-like DNA-binding protein
MLVFGDQTELHYLSHGPDEWMLVAIATARLAEWSARTENHHLLDAASRSRIGLRDADAAKTLSMRLAAAFRGCAGRTDAGDLENEVLWALAACTAPVSAAPRVAGAALAERARRMIGSSLVRGGSLLDVYHRLGAAPRTVQKVFRLRFGTSPQRYRTLLQLNHCRRLLSRPDGRDPVRRAAAASGFMHFGRLASAYREYFDELPSRTAQRAIRRSGE